MQIYSKKHLNLLRELVISQYKIKDQSKFLGFIWSFLNPLIMLTVLFSFFSLLMTTTIEHYVVYLLIGIVHYTHFANSTANSMTILYNLSQLTTEAVFPKELLVISSILANVVEFIISLLITIAVAYSFGVEFSWTVFLLPLVFIVQVMLVAWVSLFLSFFYLFVKDIDHIYQVLLRVLFFITPIFYDLSQIGGIAKTIALLNPLTHLVNFSRSLIIEGKVFAFEQWGIMFLLNIILIFIAFTQFRRLEPKFAESL